MSNSKPSHLLEIVGLCQSYHPPSGEVVVLREVDLQVKNGQTVAITGPSGSGKSTLLNLMGGLEKPTGGTISFEGENLSQYTTKKLQQFRMKKIGMVFQQHHLLPQCTAIENILLPTIPMKTSSKRAYQRAEELLAQINLTARAHHFPSQLSVGECQRIALARALINDPDLLLADEPTGSLDHPSAQRLVELLKNFVQGGKTLITVTHSDFVAEAMEKRFQLKEGRLLPVEGP